MAEQGPIVFCTGGGCTAKLGAGVLSRILEKLPRGDVYAMGGEVKTALNLVCFPESMDLNVLGEILRGGAEKVAEAGGTLAGGHSIADTGVKYGLSVTGLVDPHRLTANDTGRPGDKLLLTKALGVGLICTANRVGEAAPEQMEAAVRDHPEQNGGRDRTQVRGARRHGCDRVQLPGPSARDDGGEALLRH